MRVVTLNGIGTPTTDIGVPYAGTVYYLGGTILNYQNGHAYVMDELCCYTGTHPNYVFKCVSPFSSNTGTDPLPINDASHFKLVGTSDADAEFDDLVGTYSQRVTSHTVTIDSSNSNYVALFGLDAVSVTFNLKVSGVTKKTETINLTGSVTESSWWAYYFEDIRRDTQIKWEYPKYTSSTLTITTTTFAGSLVKCGTLRWGSVTGTVAAVQKGASSKLIDWSVKGDTYARDSGPSANNIDVSFWVERSRYDHVSRLFASLVGTVSIIDCNDVDDVDPIDNLIVYGIVGDFTKVFEYKNICKCNLSLKGVA